LAQGLEVPKLASVRLVPGTLDVREHDELEITDPTSHTLYGVHQVVIGVTPSSLNPKVGISELVVDVKHVEYAR
jgi:hypothetical protein